MPGVKFGVTVAVTDAVALVVGVAVGTGVSVTDGVGVAVDVAVALGGKVLVAVSVNVGDDVGVLVAVAAMPSCNDEPPQPLHTRLQTATARAMGDKRALGRHLLARVDMCVCLPLP